MDLAKKIVIKELNRKEEMLAAFDLVTQIYPKITPQEFEQNIFEMMQRSNYKMVAAFLDDKIIAVSGYWVAFMLYCGRYLQASNLVVDAEFRSQKIGKKILNFLEKKARQENCQRLVLDSYTENKKSHALYYREGFYIRGFHFMKDLLGE